MSALLKKIRDCRLCEASLPYKPKPICSFSSQSKIVLIGQAPGLKVHQSGVPWNDASGERLRDWLGVTPDQFYDTANFAIVPMGFCYPGKGKSGDLPPRPECAPTWMDPILKTLKKKTCTLLIGQYSQNYFLKDKQKDTLTQTIKNWKAYQPSFFVLPHPSPRNNIWLKKNAWFEKNLVPALRKTIKKLIS